MSTEREQPGRMLQNVGRACREAGAKHPRPAAGILIGALGAAVEEIGRAVDERLARTAQAPSIVVVEQREARDG